MATPSNVYGHALRRCFEPFVSNVNPESIVDDLYGLRLMDDCEMERTMLSCFTRREKSRFVCMALIRSVRTQNEFNNLVSILGKQYDFVAKELIEVVKSLKNDSSPRLPEVTYNHHVGTDRPTVTYNHHADTDLFAVTYDQDVGTDLKYPTQEVGVTFFDQKDHSHRNSYDSNNYQTPIGSCRSMSGHSQLTDNTCQCTADFSLDTARSSLSQLTDNNYLRRPTTDFSSVNVNHKFSGEGHDKFHRTRRHCSLFSDDSPCSADISVPSLLPPSNHGQQFYTFYHKNLFNELAALVNSCDEAHFICKLSGLESRFLCDPDAVCIALYLKASCSIIKSDFDTCNEKVEEGLELVKYTRTPTRFAVQLLSLRVWSQLKSGKRQQDIDYNQGLLYFILHRH